jgi:predicted transcriptional regulator
MSDLTQLTRRERQIMDIVYAHGEVSATDVMSQMPDPLTRSAIRTFLRILEAKGHLVHSKRGQEFIYRPTRPHGKAARSALRRLLGTFFGGSIEKALAMHLSDPAAKISAVELARLKQLLAKHKGE